MPLQLDVLAERQQPGRYDVGPDEGLDHPLRQRARLIRVVHADERHTPGEVGIVFRGADPVERGVEVLAVEQPDPEVERSLRLPVQPRQVSKRLPNPLPRASSPSAAITAASACSNAHCSGVISEA